MDFSHIQIDFSSMDVKLAVKTKLLIQLITVTLCLLWLFNPRKNLERLTLFDEDNPEVSASSVQQVRHKFADWRMLKDYKKRQDVKNYGKERLRINSLRKNKILPPELQVIADADIQALPRSSSVVQIVPRCSITSRPRGTVHFFRVSRIIFRQLADNNKLAGVQRAMW